MNVYSGPSEAGLCPGGGQGGRPLLLGLGLLWVCGIGLGTAWFMEFERNPGEERSAGTEWPRASTLSRLPGQTTVVLAAHPQCPCTQASLDELADLVMKSPVPIRGYVLFLRPSGLDSSWVHTVLWEQARKIPGFLPIEDLDGREADIFRATTSGHVLCFDGLGSLRFSGGITSARGTRGESAGKASLLSLLAQGTTSVSRTPVFGCPLEDHERQVIR